MLNYAAGSSVVGYNLTKSLRFRASASANLVRTPASAGDQQKFTYSGWIKRGNISSGSTNNTLISTNEAAASWALISFATDNTIQVSFTAGLSPGTYTSAVFRDPSAWYHIVVAVDTTQATAANRIKIYVNGVLQAIGTANYPAQNTNTQFNSTVIHRVGGYAGAFFDGYMADVYWIDGQALTPASFGSTNALTGVWQPAPYTGTYGTNGFYLPFTDNSALTTSSNVGLGKDFSGNGNYWTTNNISITAGVTYDSMTDVPTLTNATTANYAVLNPLNKNGNAALSAGNLTVFTASNDVNFTASTIAMVANNKYYFELTCQTVTALNFYQAVGIWSVDQFRNFDSGVYTQYYVYDGRATFYNGSAGSGAYGATWTNGDVIGVAVDMTAGSMVFYKNGVSQGTATTTINTALAYYATIFTYTTQASVNFGQRPFAYTPPTGFVALNTFNLPTSTIVKGNTVMDATLYTGNGATGQSVTNTAAFKPDLVWLKQRSAGTTFNLLYDSIRGATKYLSSNSTVAEGTVASSLTAFNSNGFTVGADPSGADNGWNASGASNVAWQWQAGQGVTSSNTSGTITSQVSVNAAAGFSVVTYTGTGANATVGHGLGVAPKMFFVKRRNSAESWAVFHDNLSTAANCLLLNLTNAQTSAPAVFNSTAPSSSVFSIGTDTATNASASTYVAYCWSEIDGFSKFGVYTGNSNADGPFIYCGFRPKFVLFKGKTFANNWYIIDSTTNTINVAGAGLKPNAADAEIATSTTENAVDFLSNGFKLRNNAASVAFNNSSGQEFVYAAFAENPFKNSLAR